jgi:inorganic pyrophosphatase
MAWHKLCRCTDKAANRAPHGKGERVMTNLLKLPTRTGQTGFHVVVESPRGSPTKFKYEPKLKVFKPERHLVLGVTYPFDWGFIPRTLAPDGDPLDAMVLGDYPTFPGVVHNCTAIGVVQISQKGASGRERNDRLIAMSTEQTRFDELNDARDLPRRTRVEIEQFFVTAVLLENKGLKLLGWGGPREAKRLLDRCVNAYERQRST